MLDPVITSELERLHIQGEGDETVRWEGVFVSDGGHEVNASTTIAFEIEPGNCLG